MWIERKDIWWKSPCVYALFKNGRVTWIGQSKNLAGRLFEHIHARDFDSVWYHYCPEKDLNRIEQYLILQVLPSENVRLIITAAAWDEWVTWPTLREKYAK